VQVRSRFESKRLHALLERRQAWKEFAFRRRERYNPSRILSLDRVDKLAHIDVLPRLNQSHPLGGIIARYDIAPINHRVLSGSCRLTPP